MVEGQPCIFCKPCGVFHEFHVGPGTNQLEAAWLWNEDIYKPSFLPGLKVKVKRDGKEWICHSYVEDGRITYFPDSEHGLAGQTVDLTL
jgi:hypothetical protein